MSKLFLVGKIPVDFAVVVMDNWYSVVVSISSVL